MISGQLMLVACLVMALEHSFGTVMLSVHAPSPPLLFPVHFPVPLQLYPACKFALQLCDSLSWDFECLLAVQVRFFCFLIAMPCSQHAVPCHAMPCHAMYQLAAAEVQLLLSHCCFPSHPLP